MGYFVKVVFVSSPQSCACYARPGVVLKLDDVLLENESNAEESLKHPNRDGDVVATSSRVSDEDCAVMIVL